MGYIGMTNDEHVCNLDMSLSIQSSIWKSLFLSRWQPVWLQPLSAPGLMHRPTWLLRLHLSIRNHWQELWDQWVDGLFPHIKIDVNEWDYRAMFAKSSANMGSNGNSSLSLRTDIRPFPLSTRQMESAPHPLRPSTFRLQNWTVNSSRTCLWVEGVTLHWVDIFLAVLKWVSRVRIKINLLGQVIKT